MQATQAMTSAPTVTLRFLEHKIHRGYPIKCFGTANMPYFSLDDIPHLTFEDFDKLEESERATAKFGNDWVIAVATGRGLARIARLDTPAEEGQKFDRITLATWLTANCGVESDSESSSDDDDIELQCEHANLPICLPAEAVVETVIAPVIESIQIPVEFVQLTPIAPVSPIAPVVFKEDKPDVLIAPVPEWMTSSMRDLSESTLSVLGLEIEKLKLINEGKRLDLQLSGLNQEPEQKKPEPSPQKASATLDHKITYNAACDIAAVSREWIMKNKPAIHESAWQYFDRYGAANPSRIGLSAFRHMLTTLGLPSTWCYA